MRSSSVVGVEHLRRRQWLVGVHAHVERGVDAVGEAAVVLVELQGRHAEVEQHGLHGVQSQVGEDVGQLVVDGVHQVHALAEGLQSLTGQGQGLAVAVDADQLGVRARPQQRLGVATHTERAVDEHRARLGQRRREQLDDPGEHDRLVPCGGVAGALHGRSFRGVAGGQVG